MNSRLVILTRLFPNRLPVTSCRSHLAFHVILVVAFSALCGCTPKPMIPYSAETPPLILGPAFAAGVVDGRSRFSRYYSVITYPDAEHISSILKSSYPGRHQGVYRFNG
jgi:hypothetical protein